jgi:D-glycero-alpha-D-manno-heptose-7-phosphate kinase
MILVQSPLRVSFFGGGTDFPDFYKKEGGCVISTAINKYIYVIVKPRFDDKIRLTYTQAELVDKVDDLQHDIVKACLKRVGVTKGIEIVTIGDVPAGSGLGSSSSVTVGILKALYAFVGKETDAEQLAKEACEIEIDTLHHPIGIQDQYIAAFGGFRYFEFFDKQVTSMKIPYGELMEHFLMFFTDITRDANKILEVQTNNVPVNFKILSEMKEVTNNALGKVTSGDYNFFGQLLDRSWTLKKKLANISTPQIDKWYKKAKDAGALGGKILGAGGGGFLLLYCPNNKKDSVREALSELSEMPFSPEPDGAKVILNYRT